MKPDSVRAVDPARTDISLFVRGFSDCIVLTRDRKILLQQRPLNWGSSAGCLTAFGGNMEVGETPIQTVIRELKEELGAELRPSNVISLAAVTEAMTDHTEIVHGYFWHDRFGTITGCYECEPAYYESVADALMHPKIMDYVRWFLVECQRRQLL